MIKELQSLCLDVRVLDKNMEEIELKDEDEDEPFTKYQHEEESYVMDTDLDSAGYLVDDEEGSDSDADMDFDLMSGEAEFSDETDMFDDDTL